MTQGLRINSSGANVVTASSDAGAENKRVFGSTNEGICNGRHVVAVGGASCKSPFFKEKNASINGPRRSGMSFFSFGRKNSEPRGKTIWHDPMGILQAPRKMIVEMESPAYKNMHKKIEAAWDTVVLSSKYLHAGENGNETRETISHHLENMGILYKGTYDEAYACARLAEKKTGIQSMLSAHEPAVTKVRNYCREIKLSPVIYRKAMRIFISELVEPNSAKFMRPGADSDKTIVPQKPSVEASMGGRHAHAPKKSWATKFMNFFRTSKPKPVPKAIIKDDVGEPKDFTNLNSRFPNNIIGREVQPVQPEPPVAGLLVTREGRYLEEKRF